MPMPRRALIWIASATTIALVASLVAVITYTVVDEDRSVLPGVPQSDLPLHKLEIELADPAEFTVPREAAVERVSIFTGGLPTIDVIPVKMRSEELRLFDGPAWAVVVDTSYGRDTPPLSAPVFRGYVMKSMDYFVAFVDAECGEVLRAISPGSELRDWPDTPAGFYQDGEPIYTEFCPPPQPGH